MVRIGDQATRGDYRCASYASMAGAFLFMLSFICFAVALGQESQAEAKKQDNFAKYKQLDPTIVYELWEGRRKSQTAHLLGELTASIGWLSLLPAVGSLGQVAGGQDGRSAVRFMTACFQGAAMVSVIDFTFQAGLHSMTDWLSTWPIMQPDYSAVIAKDAKAALGATNALCPDDDGDCGQHDWQDDDDDACKEECPDGTCNSMADHDKPECAACAACHDHDGDGKADHAHDDMAQDMDMEGGGAAATSFVNVEHWHDDMAQDMEGGGAAATSFVQYVTYVGPNGDLFVSGSVRATESKGMIHQMWYDLEGVDSLCNRGPDSSISNSCGIHIHKGTSCTSDALGHLYNPVGGLETDPWGVGHYTSVPPLGPVYRDPPMAKLEYTAKSWFTVPHTGLSAADIMGKTVIIHGKDGGRIACGILVAPTSHTGTTKKQQEADGPDWHPHDGGFGPLQALELDFLVARSRTLWLFALDELLLTAGWGAAAYLAYTSSQLSSRWGHLSVFGACIAVLGFIFAIVRMFKWRPFAQVYLVTAALVDFLILPVWILWLAAQLRNLSAMGAYASSVEMAPALAVGATKSAEADANVV
jgi:hypothetical protein